MGRFVGRRLVAALFLLLGITLVTFVLTNVVPGDPAAANLGQRAIADPEAVASFNHRYGLDKPLPVQYFTYLGNLVQGDLGDSQQSHRPVRTDLAEFVPATLELAGTAIAIGMVIGIGLGTLAAFRRDRPVDWVLRVVSLGRRVDTAVLAVARRALRPDVPLADLPRLRSPPTGRHPAADTSPACTRSTPCCTATWRRSATRSMRLLLPALVLAIYAARPDHPLHPQRRARGARQRLRPRGVRQGPADAHDRHPPRAAGGAGADHHGHRRHVRRAAGRHRAGREDLRLARHRHLRLPQRHHARPPGDHGGRAVRGAGLHRAQPRRRRAVRRDRPAGAPVRGRRARGPSRRSTRPSPSVSGARVAGGARAALRRPLTVAGDRDGGDVGWCCWCSATSSPRSTPTPRTSSASRARTARTGSAPTGSGATCSAG